MRRILFGLIALTLTTACGPPAPVSDSNDQTNTPEAKSVYQPLEPDVALLWDRQITDTADLLHALIDRYNATEPVLSVQAEYIGNYGEIFKKVQASIRAKRLPAMAVGYESMTTVYIEAGAVAPLDPLLNDSEIGYGSEELADFFPGVIETNTYSDYGGMMYSFPYTKSVLVLYFNRRVLTEAGIEEPPRTWDEFLSQCRQVKANTGKFGFSFDIDPSTVDGMILSHGGKLTEGRETQFDQPAALAVFGLLETLFKEKLAFQNPPGSYDDSGALARDEVAFILRTSSSLSYIDGLMEGDRERWGVSTIPQVNPENPVTVLYGGNIIIFNTTEAQRRAAWKFVKYFTQPSVMAEWAVGTGYLPTRRSAQDEPVMQKHWEEWEYNRVAFDCLSFARSEPNLTGWQEVREEIKKAATAVITGVESAEKAANDLKVSADHVLAARAR
jgi:ABC-type glycerol-3-phosphate transport system substrate-binding protein